MSDLIQLLHALSALDPPGYRHLDVGCSRCGRKIQVTATHDQPVEGVSWLCPQCSSYDRPEDRPDTGWR